MRNLARLTIVILFALLLTTPVIMAQKFLLQCTDEFNLLARNISTGEVSWTVHAGDHGCGQITIANDMIYTITSYSDSCQLVALDFTGLFVWQSTLPPTVLTAMAKIAPAVVGDVAYVVWQCQSLNAADTNGIYAFDALLGTQLWHFATTPTLRNPVVLSNNSIIFTTQGQGGSQSQGGQLVKLSPKGALVWQTQLPIEFEEPTGSSVALSLDEKVAYLIDGIFCLSAFDTETGSLLWTSDVGSGLDQPLAVGPDGTIYCSGTANGITAVSPQGEQLWHYTSGLSDLRGIIVSPRDGTIYASGLTNLAPDYASLIAVNSGGNVHWVHSFLISSLTPWITGPTLDARQHVFFTEVTNGFAYVGVDGSNYWGTTDLHFYRSDAVAGCNCPPPYTYSRCAVACMV